MGNGFPVGGILVHPSIKSRFGMLGSTFGGNHLACAAVIAVLDVLEKEQLMPKVKILESYFRARASQCNFEFTIKGRGLMLGLDLGMDVGNLRKRLIHNHHIFTGGAKNKNVLRILPPLIIEKAHINQLFMALEQEL